MKKRIVSPEGAETAKAIIEDFFDRWPEAKPCRGGTDAAFRAIRDCYKRNGTLFVCGNGGSYADALHISGEFMKSFERKRPVREEHRRVLESDALGRQLIAELEDGLRAIPLGLNGSLSSAIWNDKQAGGIHFAQELYVLGDLGDVLLAISTSGNSRSVVQAIIVARALGLKTIGLTGPGGGEVARKADIALRLPGKRTWEAQESHQALYHALCRAVEAAFFPEPKGS